MTVRTLWTLLVGLLAGLSVVLIAGEVLISQSFARHYLSDLHGAASFHGVNTTVSVAFLWGTALLFLVSAGVLGRDPATRRLRLFCASQVAVFGFLGLDDRFQLHERLDWHFGVGDHWALVAVGVAEVCFLVFLGRREVLGHPSRRRLLVAVLLAGVMLAIDAFVSSYVHLRLTIEDLAKTWSALFFLLWAWSLLFWWIDMRPRGSAPDEPRHSHDGGG